MPTKEWIVSPGLRPYVDEFLKLTEIILSEKEIKHLLLCGDTGVGKSLFVALFLHEYKVKHPNSNTLRINIASLNKDLIESELFGHVKGAFTGAQNHRPGFLKDCDNGLLILEELGEIPVPIQAKLLTFLEDGYFYPVGSEKKQLASVQIIATTNKPKDIFREDFWNRLFPFFIPPVYQRVVDVLFYIHAKYPDALASMSTQDLLAFLLYHWPGNVREIETICTLYRWKTNRHPQIKMLKPSYFMMEKNNYSTVTTHPLVQLSKQLTSFGVDGQLIEKTIHKLGFNFNNYIKTKNNNPTISSAFNLNKIKKVFYRNTLFNSVDENGIKYNIVSVECAVFESIAERYVELHKLFLYDTIDPSIDILFGNIKFLKSRLLSCHAGELTIPAAIDIVTNQHYSLNDQLWGNNYNQALKLQKQLFEFRIGRKLSNRIKDLVPIYIDQSLYPPYQLIQELQDIQRDNEIDNFFENQTEEQILRKLYTDRINRFHGNKVKAAESLGIKTTTFRSRLKKHDIS